MTGGRLDRRAAWAMFAVTVLSTAALGAVLVPWDWVPGGSLRPVDATDVFSPAWLRRAEDYAATVRMLSWASYATSLLVACLLGFTPLGARVARALTARLRWWLAVPVLTFVVLAAGRLATLPLGLGIRARRFEEGLTTQPVSGWLLDRLFGWVVAATLFSLALLIVVGLARRWPRRWFAGAGAGVAVLALGASMVYPVVVEPLFNRFTPLPSTPFQKSILRLAAAESVDVDEVLVADASRRTTTLNAYVSGFGGTRRIVVYDTLLDGATPAQARAVVAHELAHAKHRDVLLGTVLGSLGGVAAVTLLALLLDSTRVRRRTATTGPGDPAVVPLVLALVAVGGFLVSPVQSTVSRALEARADRTALEATQDPAAFTAMQEKLALRSLADPTPPAWSQFWFGSHPTVLQRLGMPAALGMESAGR